MIDHGSVPHVPTAKSVLEEDRKKHGLQDVTGSGRPLTAEAKQIVANVITMLPVLMDARLLARGEIRFKVSLDEALVGKTGSSVDQHLAAAIGLEYRIGHPDLFHVIDGLGRPFFGHRASQPKKSENTEPNESSQSSASSGSSSGSGSVKSVHSDDGQQAEQAERSGQSSATGAAPVLRTWSRLVRAQKRMLGRGLSPALQWTSMQHPDSCWARYVAMAAYYKLLESRPLGVVAAPALPDGINYSEEDTLLQLALRSSGKAKASPKAKTTANAKAKAKNLKNSPSEAKRMKQLQMAMYRQSNMKDVTQMLVLLDGLKLQKSSEHCGLLTGALVLQRSDAVFIEQRLIGQCIRRTLRNLGLTCEALAHMLENLLGTLSDYVRPPKDPAKPDAIRHGLHVREWLDMYWILTRPFKHLCWKTLLALPRLLCYGIFQDVRLRFGNDPVHGGAAGPEEWAAIEKKRKEQLKQQLKKLNEEQQTTPSMLPMLSPAERQSSFREVVAGFKLASSIFAGLGQQFQVKVLQSEAVQVPRPCMDAACVYAAGAAETVYCIGQVLVERSEISDFKRVGPDLCKSEIPTLQGKVGNIDKIHKSLVWLEFWKMTHSHVYLRHHNIDGSGAVTDLFIARAWAEIKGQAGQSASFFCRDRKARARRWPLGGGSKTLHRFYEARRKRAKMWTGARLRKVPRVSTGALPVGKAPSAALWEQALARKSRRYE
ncbi:unnamed protein product [Symbiodinium microadriaticum]|nr:unnamed protein product [Symbiodinium microadriaticum]